jgi:hypothetical protein
MYFLLLLISMFYKLLMNFFKTNCRFIDGNANSGAKNIGSIAGA